MTSTKTRVRLPVDSDFAAGSLLWAIDLLAEKPVVLWVTAIDYDAAKALFPEVAIDPALSCYSWRLEGETREVFSEGA